MSYCVLQIVDELLTYWNLEDADDTLEELEEALIVSSWGDSLWVMCSWANCACKQQAQQQVLNPDPGWQLFSGLPNCAQN